MFLPGQWYEFLCFVVECSLCFWFTWNRWSFLRFLQGHIRSAPPPIRIFADMRIFANEEILHLIYSIGTHDHHTVCTASELGWPETNHSNCLLGLLGLSWRVSHVYLLSFSQWVWILTFPICQQILFFSRASSFNFYWQIRQKLLTHL